MAPEGYERSALAAISRSTAVVTLKFSAGASTTRTDPPTASTSDASSVAAASVAASTLNARRNTSATKTWGGWIAHRVERSSVRVTRRSASTSLTVSTTGAAAMAPSNPSSSPAMQRSTSSRVMNGRAASCTTATVPSGAAASARRTESERTAPPSTESGYEKPGGTATTTRSHTERRTSRLHSISGRPAQTTNALGRSDPRRSPRPAAGTMPTTVKTSLPKLAGCRWGAVPLGVRVPDQRIEVLLGLALVHLERVHQLRGEDLLRARVHLLLPRRESLLGLPDREVANDLGQLVHVARLDLVAVVLEATVPVLRHLADVVAQHGEDLLHGLVVDHAPQARLGRVLARDHHRHVVVQDLDRQVLATLAEHRLLLLFEDLACPVVGIHDAVTDGVLLHRQLALEIEVLDVLLPLFRDGCLPWSVFASVSGLQIAIDEVDLLQTAKALTDVLRTHVSDPLDSLQLGVGGGQYLVQPRELAHYRLDHELRQARDAPKDPVAARRHGVVKGVQLAVVPEQLRQAPEVEHVLVREPREGVEHEREALLGVLGEVVVDEGRLVGGDADHRLLELHLDQPALGAELDDVALDLDGHAGHELGPLEDREHVVKCHAALELERGQAGRDLLEAAAVLLERGERLVRLGEDDRDVLEDVLRPVEVERDDVAPLRDRDHERAGLLRHALGGAVAGARLERHDRRVGHQLDVGPADLRAVGAQDDRAVHLRHLVEQGGRVVDVELDPARVEERELVAVADREQGAGARVEDVVEALAERRAGRHHLERPYEPGLLTVL